MAEQAAAVMDRDADAVAAVRAFNRFYTNVIGVLRGGHLDSPYSLTEVRVLFELARQEATEVARLRQSLDIDAGYLSRILSRFDTERLTTRRRSAADGRRQVIRLTEAGQAVFAELDTRQTEQTERLLAGIGDRDRRRLLAAMEAIQQVLPGASPDSTPDDATAGPEAAAGPGHPAAGPDAAAGPGDPAAGPDATADGAAADEAAAGPDAGRRGLVARPRAYLLRPPRPGDLGWVVHRHGAVYAQEYGWDETFEFLVARIVADYAAGRDPEREAAWIAEVDGEPAGCVFCVRKDASTAQLRLLLVEPSARGLGIGGRLVEECLRFARAAGYRQVKLWTQDCLTAARRIYQAAGFRLTAEGEHHSFGHDLVEQTWSRQL
jgi:DNA-binding MarR family transcriptional regulator/GNAT superfamily N-acetyltransferase